MSSGESAATMPAITAFLRSPLLKLDKLLGDVLGDLARKVGFAGMALLPSAPWQAEQTWVTICCALAGSAGAGSAAQAHQLREGRSEHNLRRG